MTQPQEGAESILNYTKPTEPVNLTFWQTCKAHPLPAIAALTVVLALVGSIFYASWSVKPATSAPGMASAPATEAITSLSVEPEQTAKKQIGTRFTPKKGACKAINTPACSSNLPDSDDVLGDFITDLEHKKLISAHVSMPKTKEPVPSVSNFGQDFETRLSNFERLIP